MIMTTAAVPIGAALLAATACPIRPLAAYMAAAEAKGRDVMVHPRGKIMMMMRTVVFLIAPGDRKSVVEGKGVSERVELGGRNFITKRNTNNKTMKLSTHRNTHLDNVIFML